MTEAVVCDASAVVAVLLDSGPDGEWATEQLVGTALLDLAIEERPFALLGTRVWKLRQNLTSYDASYVAVAELTGAPLVTLDARIGRAPQLRCDVITPTRSSPAAST